MKSRAFKGFLLLLLLIILSGAVGCITSSSEGEREEASSELSSAEETGENVFYATVTATESDFGGILVEPESNILPAELVVHPLDTPKLSVGDRVRVEHSGQITLSLPGQIYGARVTLAE